MKSHESDIHYITGSPDNRSNGLLGQQPVALAPTEIAKFTPEEVQTYEDSLKSYRDLKNSLDTAREEGRQEGKEEGKFEEKRLTVLKSHQAGLSLEVISSITGLSQDEIQKIIEEG